MGPSIRRIVHYRDAVSFLCIASAVALGNERLSAQIRQPDRLETEHVVHLTLQQCISIALDKQPAINAQYSATRAAFEDRNVARSYFFPQIDFITRYAHLDDPLTVDFPSIVTGPIADVFSDASAYFGIAREAGSAVANAALDNPNLPPFATAKQAALQQLPETFQAGLIGEDSLTTEFSLTQPVWTGGKIRYRYKQAELGSWAAEADLDKSRQQTVFDVTRAYLSIQFAHELHKVVSDAIGRFRAIDSLIQALLDELDENVTTVDLHRVRAVRLLTEGEEIRLAQAMELAKASLRQAMGVEYDSEFEITPPRLTIQTKKLQLPAILDQAMRRRPELTKARLGVRITILEQKLAKAQYVPDVGLFGRFAMVDDDGGFLNPNDQQREQWTVGVSVGVPLYTGGGRAAAKRQAEFQHARAHHLQRLARELITLEVQRAYLEYMEASKNLPLARQAMTEAEQTLNGYQQQFPELIKDEDMPDYFEDLISAILLLTRAQTTYNSTVHQYNLVLAKIRLVTGRDALQPGQTLVDDS